LAFVVSVVGFALIRKTGVGSDPALVQGGIGPAAMGFGGCAERCFGRLKRAAKATIMRGAGRGWIKKMRRLLGAVALLGVLAGGAHAQVPFLPYIEPAARPSENALQQAESERVHRQALKNIPDRKASNDPWRSVRATAINPTIDRHKVE
jgi:hypothetical protein